MKILSRRPPSERPQHVSDRTQEVVHKHSDEALPIFPKVKFASLIPAFRELSNGNIGYILETSAMINVDKDSTATVFVVNNPLLYELIAQEFADGVFSQQKAEQFIRDCFFWFRTRGKEATHTEEQILEVLESIGRGYQNDWSIIKRAISSYYENQCSIRLLQLINDGQAELNRVHNE